MRLCVVVGTRPEIIKMASIIQELRVRREDFVLVHTGQHYDSNLSDVFFKELELPSPDISLATGSGTQAEQTARGLIGLERAFRRSLPDTIVVEGDTNAVLAASLAGAKMGIDVAHVEAGLRSYDLRMPEEHNRRLTDHLSRYLFAPTPKAADTLRKESCWGKIYVTGNTIIDACLRFGAKAIRASSLNSKVPFKNFALATAHRAENVDDPAILREFLQVFKRSPIPVVYPIHPRTRHRFRTAGLEAELKASENVMLLPPVGYLDFLALLIRCTFVLTDSGGIQEEATAPNIRKKVFVMRNSTERPEAVEAGYAEIVGTTASIILRRVERFLKEDWRPRRKSPFGNGRAGREIVEILTGQRGP